MYAIEKKMPESGERVIFGWLNANAKRRTSIGFWAAPRDISAEACYESDDYVAEGCEYDEIAGIHLLPTGWYEESAGGENFNLQQTPTHWMDLPTWPAV